MERSKGAYFSYNSLSCIAEGIAGFYTTVDLRNDSFVSGKIDQVDGLMNITMSDVVFTDQSGNECYFDNFFIKERNVRYIHIPNEVDIKEVLMKKFKLTAPKVRKERPMTIKRKRLLERQQETLKRVEEIKKERFKKKMEQQKAGTSSES